MDTKLDCMQTVEVKGKNVDYTVTNVGPVNGGEGFLFVSENTTFLLDDGFSFCGNALVDNIKKVLGDRGLDYILLTHSHYDHLSGTPYCTRAFPDVKVVANDHTANVIVREGARATMKKMNAAAAQVYGVKEYEDLVDQLRVDIVVREGDVIDLGDFKFKVYGFPGHTKCSIGFYSEEEKLLLSCETLGVYIGDEKLACQYLVGYQMSIDSIDKALSLDIDSMLIPHTGIVTGDRCKSLLSSSRKLAEDGAKEIVYGFRAGKTEKELLDILKEKYYTPYVRELQPEPAFDLNAGYMIPMLIKELAENPDF